MIQEQTYLEQLPQPALEVRDGAVCAMNAAARMQLPSLAPGSPVPEFLTLPLTGTEQTGSFEQEGETFLFTRLSAPEKQLLLFRPAGDNGLTASQVEGFSRQMRGQMALLLNQVELLSSRLKDRSQGAEHLSTLNHSFHQILRLVNNLEFLNIPQDQAQALFSSVTMDLAGLCQQLRRQAAPMLRKAGVDLQFVSPCAGLLIPGDPQLLQRLILSLISNAAKAAPGGSVTLDLRPWGDKAVLTVSDSSTQDVDLSTLLSPGDDHIPTPGEGAGMGLAVVRRIAQLHGGTLFSRTGKGGGLTFTVALPTGPLGPSLALHSPSAESDAGVSPFLLELADLLPSELFELDPD